MKTGLLLTTLRKVYDRYQLQVNITENGLGAFDTVEEDGIVHVPYRIDYFEKVHRVNAAGYY